MDYPCRGAPPPHLQSRIWALTLGKMTGTAKTAYKILTADQWAQFQADGVFAGAPVDLVDGYIHLSAADQVQGTLDKHFAGPDGKPQAGLVIAEIDLTLLGDAVLWEASRGGALFPHVYGRPLPVDAVLAVREA
jgi:uncharacterized protein (DUF952 family)